MSVSRYAVAAAPASGLRLPRPIVFAAVGLAVAAFGVLLLVVLVEFVGVSPHLAYLIQAVAAIELNFALSHFLTWGDRRRVGSRIARAWPRFHATRILTIPGTQLLFSGLVLGGCPYLLATAVCIAAAAGFNYAAGDRWVFRGVTR